MAYCTRLQDGYGGAASAATTIGSVPRFQAPRALGLASAWTITATMMCGTCARFVQCLDFRIELARQRRDDLTRDFAHGSRRVVEAIAQDLADGVPPPAELRRFLARTAYPFRRHPAFRSEWTRYADRATYSASTPGPAHQAIRQIPTHDSSRTPRLDVCAADHDQLTE